jgi:hypothetical protein
MSTTVLPNFDWALSEMTRAVEFQATAAAMLQYRLSATMRLIPFGIHTKKDLISCNSVDATGLVTEHIKLFLAKKLVLGWLYLKRDRMFCNQNTVCRLSAYVRYYDEILKKIRAGDRNILERWWVLETTSKFSQHSATRVPRIASLDTESLVIGSTLIDWNLGNIYPVKNLALVSKETLDKAADHVDDWIREEVEREVPPEELDGEL